MRALSLLSLAVLAASASAGCPDDTWQEFQGKCYWLYDHIIFGDKMPELCSKMFGADASLLSVHSIEEHEFVIRKVLKKEMKQSWLGMMRDDDDSPYEWFDGTPLDFEDWADGEPFDGSRCAVTNVFGEQGKWYGASCGVGVQAICQTKATP